MSVLKRQRERNRAEKAAAKREQRLHREPADGKEGGAVASRDELESYGIVVERGEEERERRPR